MYVIIIKKAMYCKEQEGEIFCGWKFETKEQAKINLDFYQYYFPNLLLQVEEE